MPVPIFTSNYPNFQPGPATLLSTPERVGALPNYRGRGVVIAFIDAGFYPHPDLKNRILVHVDASTHHVIEQTREFPTSDLSWHGQMTSVIACGDGKTSNSRYRGIASAAKLVLVKVSTPKGHIKESDISRGLRWLIDTYQRFNIRVVNISVGGDFISNDPNHPLHRVIRKLTNANVSVVVAAGNRNISHLLPPASASEAITVGGIDDHNTLDRTCWTLYNHNYGSSYDGRAKPEVVATANWLASPIMPGSMVAREAKWLAPLLESPSEEFMQSIIKRGYRDLGLTGDQIKKRDKLYEALQNRINAHKIIDAYHQYVDGTSVAAPIVSSVIAQMLEANPRLTTHQIRAILADTATPISGYPPERQGAGLLNAAAAVQAGLALL
jgi:serine protease AprX